MDAYADIARHYEKGHGVEKNLDKSYNFTIAAARKGHKASQRKVVSMYQQGLGVERSLEKSRYWLKILIKQGDKASKIDFKRLQKR